MDIGLSIFPTDYSIHPATLGREAEARGFESLFITEHTHIPASRRTPYPGGGDLPSIYWESFGTPPTGEVEVPTGCSIFPKEIIRCSRRWAEKRFHNIVYWNELEKGGHFAAFEQPETFVNEIRACFRGLR